MFSKMRSGYGVAAVAFAVGWVLFALPWLSGDVTVPWDAKAHFLPQLQFLANALHTGQSPAWNHNVFGGSPQIADPQSLIFSPAFLLAYFEPNPSFRQLDLYCFLLLAAAGFSVLMFFRDRGWHPAGAIVAALATALGGSSIWRIQHIKQIETFAFLMLTLWLLARALEKTDAPVRGAGGACRRHDGDRAGAGGADRLLRADGIHAQSLVQPAALLDLRAPDLSGLADRRHCRIDPGRWADPFEPSVHSGLKPPRHPLSRRPLAALFIQARC